MSQSPESWPSTMSDRCSATRLFNRAKLARSSLRLTAASTRQARAAAAGERWGGSGPSREALWVNEGRAEFAGGEGVEGEEAGGEFEAGEAAFAIETTEEVGSGRLAFLGVALDAGGDQVAIGVAA